jgi:hypothetical protein
VEHVIGLLRHYLPKKQDFATIVAEQLKKMRTYSTRDLETKGPLEGVFQEDVGHSPGIRTRGIYRMKSHQVGW